ncbi:YutD family protein [Virgibacillus oceani]
MIELQGKHYELIENIKDGFQKEAIEERYSEVLEKYDYIVGDWGYDQLRLKGFYRDDQKKAPIDGKISTLDDYLYEYCNFGCAYFVIKKKA